MLLTAEQVQALAERVFIGLGATPPNASIMAEIVARAECGGTLSHGLLRLPDYASSIRAGWLDASAEPAFDTSDGPVLRADGRNGFTQVAAATARPLLRERARRDGLAMLAVRNAHHVGALWTDVEPLAEDGLVVVNFINSRPLLAPYGARGRRLGSNAMSFGFPDGEGGAIVWDQASSVMSFGDVRRHANDGLPLPEGAGLDRDGNPTTDPRALLDGGAMLPFGGAKGGSIALMVEVMAAAVAGGNFGYEDRSAGFPGAASSNAGQVMLVIDPSFTSGMPAVDRLAAFIRYLRRDPQVRLPGDRRRAFRAQAAAAGVEVSDATIARLEALTQS
jgi:delta1-piperideine-2-carboxylate reductase